MQSLYQMITSVHGVILEFGVRWGQNMALFSALRGIHEPFNYNRRVIGFDTFEAFPAVFTEDGQLVASCDHTAAIGWKDELEKILDTHALA